MAAGALLLGGCFLDIDFKDTAFLCSSDPTCPEGYTCVDGRCVQGEGGDGPDGGAGGGDPDGAPVADLAFRRQLTFANGERGELTDFPLMVRLDPTRIEYDAVRADGGDIQFRDADGTPLPHEIESWNPGETSVLWVRVPAIDGGSTDDHVFMYYGNPDVTVAPNAAALWADYRAVYHLDPQGVGAVEDSTAQGFDGTAVGADGAEGQIGRAYEFNGTDQYLDLGADRSFISGVAGATAEAWVAPGAALTAQIALGISINGADSSRLQFRVSLERVINAGARTADGGDLVQLDGLALPELEWTWVVMAFDFAGDAITIYQNGEQAAAATAVGFADATPDTTSNVATIGVDENKTSNFWLGRIDEVRVAAGPPPSADRVSAQYASMTDVLVSYGPVEPQ
ncbi:MAG TPA: DUF2341 domain-containing protein [Kofleriaceae bacterium]|nr:DUF2341 domain-containing protein [Kofleriaceae bacterium]